MGRELQRTHVCNNVHCNEHERNEHGDHHQKHPLMQITEGKKKAKNVLAAEKSTCTFCTHIIKSITSYKWGTVHKLAGKRCALDILSLDAVRVSVMSIISWIQLIARAWCSFAQAATKFPPYLHFVNSDITENECVNFSPIRVCMQCVPIVRSYVHTFAKTPHYDRLYLYTHTPHFWYHKSLLQSWD